MKRQELLRHLRQHGCLGIRGGTIQAATDLRRFRDLGVPPVKGD
jgi:hypothetical protein